MTDFKVGDRVSVVGGPLRWDEKALTRIYRPVKEGECGTIAPNPPHVGSAIYFVKLDSGDYSRRLEYGMTKLSTKGEEEGWHNYVVEFDGRRPEEMTRLERVKARLEKDPYKEHCAVVLSQSGPEYSCSKLWGIAAYHHPCTKRPTVEVGIDDMWGP